MLSRMPSVASTTMSPASSLSLYWSESSGLSNSLPSSMVGPSWRGQLNECCCACTLGACCQLVHQAYKRDTVARGNLAAGLVSLQAGSLGAQLGLPAVLKQQVVAHTCMQPAGSR